MEQTGWSRWGYPSPGPLGPSKQSHVQLRQEGQSWESVFAGCKQEFNQQVGAYTELYVLHSQLRTGAMMQGGLLGTFSFTDFQDFLLLCGPFPFSQRNDENRQ